MNTKQSNHWDSYGVFAIATYIQQAESEPRDLDSVWDEAIFLYNRFLESDCNNVNQSELDCIYQFLNTPMELEQERKLVTTYRDGQEVYEGDRFVNQCDITNEGMNEGWILGEGDMYIKYESDAIDFCKTNYNMTLQEAYDNELIYWTEWDIVSCDELSYEIKNGQLIEIEF